MVAARAIRAGERVLWTLPVAVSPTDASNSPRCAVCRQRTEDDAPLMKCTRCQYVRYCGRDCQTRDWRHHKVECKWLRTPTARALPHDDNSKCACACGVL